MSHPLDGCSAKLDRAAEHLFALQVAAVRYLDPSPWNLLGEILRNPDRYVVTVGVKKDPPLRLGTIFGDLMHNLRSSLDYLVYQLVRLNGHDPDERTAFPIFGDPPRRTFANASEDALRGVADEPKALIEELQPYNRTDAERDALVAVRKFSNRDKHRTVVPFIAAMQHPGDDPDLSFTTNEDAEFLGEFTVKSGGPWTDGKEIVSAPIRITGPDPHVEMHGNINVEVAFGEDTALRIDAMPATIGEIIRTIRRFEPFFGSTRPERQLTIPPLITLTASQSDQLRTFVEETDFEGRVALRPAANLGAAHVEAILLGNDGRDTSKKRILFP